MGYGFWWWRAIRATQGGPQGGVRADALRVPMRRCCSASNLNICDLAFPADEGANLPDPAGLQSYDGVVLTGSALNLYDETPAVTRQIELMRAVYASGRRLSARAGEFRSAQPQPAAMSAAIRRAGKSVRPPHYATEAGRTHPMLRGVRLLRRARHPSRRDGRPPAIAHPCDECHVRDPGGRNPSRGGTFWGVQYHPEFSLAESRPFWNAGSNPDRGRVLRNRHGRGRLCGGSHGPPWRAEPPDLAWRHGLDAEVLDPMLRTREIRNFVESRVKPETSRRGRA